MRRNGSAATLGSTCARRRALRLLAWTHGPRGRYEGRCSRATAYNDVAGSAQSAWGSALSINYTSETACWALKPSLLAILKACVMSLRRFGIPSDLAFLIVALLVVAAGAFALIFGLRGLKPSRFIPSKSISQVSSLLGELQDGADFR